MSVNLCRAMVLVLFFLWRGQPALLPTVDEVVLHDLHFGLYSKSTDEVEGINEAPEDPYWKLNGELLRTRPRPPIIGLCAS